MKFLVIFLFILPCLSLLAKEETKYSRPVFIKTEELRGFEQLVEKRKVLVVAALELAEEARGRPYHFGGATPETGFDCSGAVYYLLRSLGHKAPRTSAQQYVWLLDQKRITAIPDTVESLDDAVFATLRPGDLLFWSGTYQPTDGRQVKVTHVGIFLGREKKDGRWVMICSSEGRSYRRTACSGFGVFDFRIPSKKSRSKLMAFGAFL